MQITFLRSSSYGAYDFCQHRYWLEYVLGMKSPPNWKAEKGNMFHKAMELLARRKLAEQEGKSSFLEPELEKEFSLEQINYDTASRLGYEHYRRINAANHCWSEQDFRDVLAWVRTTVEFRNGAFDPLRRDILVPEQFFEFSFDEPWAHYRYTLADGSVIDGQLGIKGTIDLVTRVAPGVIEYVDWKTGKRWDWGKDVEKSPEKLRRDPQLLLYLYALSRLYPDYRTIFITIYFVADGGPFTVPFDRSDIDRARQMLRKRFEEIRRNDFPSRILHNEQKQWKCFRLCSFYKEEKEGVSQCEYYHRELLSLGMERATQRHARSGALLSYGSGGGRQEKSE